MHGQQNILKNGKLSNHGNQGSHGNQCNHGNITNQGDYVNVINQNTHTCSYENICFMYPIANTTLRFLRILVKILNKNFHAVHSKVVEMVHAGRPMDHDKANIRFSPLCCERAKSMVCAR
jgi:hypothetical protein